MDSPHRCSCADDPPDLLDPAPSRRTSRLQHWISEQCHLAVSDLGLELEPLFSASTYVPVGQRPQVQDAGVNHKKTPSGDSVSTTHTTTSSASSSPSKKSASGDALIPRDKDGWYWRTSSSSGSSEGDSLLASYVMPTIPEPTFVPATPVIQPVEDEDDLDARSDSPVLGFASDSDDGLESPEEKLEAHRRSKSSDDFPHTPGPEDMDATFLVLSPPLTPNPHSVKEKERIRSPTRDKLRYPAKGYRRELPSGLEDVNPSQSFEEESPLERSPTQSLSRMNTPRYRCSLHSEQAREESVSTPTPHQHVNYSYGFQQQRPTPTSSSSPSLIPSSPSLFPTSSLSSYPSVTSLSSLHSRPSVASLHSLHSLSSEGQHQQQLPSPRPTLSRKPSIARKPSFPLLKEVKEEEAEALAGPTSHTSDGEDDQRERTMGVSPTEDSLSPTGTDDTMITPFGALLPSAPILTTAPPITTNRSAMAASRMRSLSASTGTSSTLPASGHAYSHSYSHTNHVSVVGSSGSGYAPAMLGPNLTRASVGFGLGPGVGVRTQTRSRSNSSVGGVDQTYPSSTLPTRASIGLGLGPGVGVRTQTRSRSNSYVAVDADMNPNMLPSTQTRSIYSTCCTTSGPPPSSFPSSLSLDLGTRTPPGTAMSAMSVASVSVASTPGIGAGARHAMYIVDSEEVSRRLGELLQNATGEAEDYLALAEEVDDDDEEGRRRTVMALEDDDGIRMGEREIADPVLPLGDFFTPARAVSQEGIEGAEEAYRPSTPPPPIANRSSVATNLTPTRRVPYPNPGARALNYAHTPSPSFASIPPPNTPASAGAFGSLYASPYASTSQIYLGPQGSHSRGSSGDSVTSELAKDHFKQPSPQSQSHVLPQHPPLLPSHSHSPSFSQLAPSLEVSQHVERESLLPSAPILTKADLASRLGPPPKRPPPAPPLDLGLELGLGLGEGFRFPPSPSLMVESRRGTFAEEQFGEYAEEQQQRCQLFEEEELEPELGDEEDAYGGIQGDCVDEGEMEAFKREMGLSSEDLYEELEAELGMRRSAEESVRSLGADGAQRVGDAEDTIKARGRGRPPLSVVVPQSPDDYEPPSRDVGMRKEGMQSRWSIASSVVLKEADTPVSGRNAGGKRASASTSNVSSDYLDAEAMGMMGVSVGGLMGIGSTIGTKRWRRRSREPGSKEHNQSGKEAKNSKAKSAPASPISSRKDREDKRKSFARGDGADGSPQQPSHQLGGKRSRLASFFSKLAGSGHSSAVSTPASAGVPSSAGAAQGAKSTNSTSEPDLRVVSGAWEAMPSEQVPPVPPVPPLHTLPRMPSKASMISVSKAGTVNSRRATMMSQSAWDDEEYYGSVPPTPSSLMAGFSGSGCASPGVGTGSGMPSPRGSVVGGMSLRTSRSVSNLNLGGMQRSERDGMMVRVMSPPGTPLVSTTPDVVVAGEFQAVDGERESVLPLPPPPVPPKDYSAPSAGYEWPSVPVSLKSGVDSPIMPVAAYHASPTTYASTQGHVGGKVHEDKARDRMMVRLRLKSSPSLGNLKSQQQSAHAHSGGRTLRSFAARMMGRESGSGEP